MRLHEDLLCEGVSLLEDLLRELLLEDLLRELLLLGGLLRELLLGDLLRELLTWQAPSESSSSLLLLSPDRDSLL